MKNMTDLERFQLVNETKNTSQLRDAVVAIAVDGLINSPTGSYDAVEMSFQIEAIIESGRGFQKLTRQFGIRQQAIFLHSLGR